MKPGQRSARVARSDAELLQRVAARDVEALGELYDRYARDAWRVARRIVATDADSEDVVHAVFIKLPEIASSYDGRASSWGWLCGVTVRVALRHRRGAGRFRRMLGAFAAALVRTPPADPERHASGHQDIVAFEEALGRLSDKKRAAFVLVELEGLSIDEAAKALEIPAATARTRLFHARRELHASMRERGGPR